MKQKLKEQGSENWFFDLQKKSFLSKFDYKSEGLEIIQDKKIALLIGVTGLVGRSCLPLLVTHKAYHKIILFTESPLNLDHPKIEEQVVDFDRLDQHGTLFTGNDFFCCLGSSPTQATDREAFYKVDYKQAYAAASVASENGVNQLFMMSAVGANPEATLYFSRVKGELEEAVKKLPFWSIHIFQPSLLLRDRNENRWGEKWANKLGKVIDSATGGLLTKYKPVEAEVVAQAMINAAQRLDEGIHVYPSHLLQQLAAEEDDKLDIAK